MRCVSITSDGCLNLLSNVLPPNSGYLRTFVYSLDYSFDVPICLCSLRSDFTMFESLCFCKFRDFSSIEWWAVIRFYFLRYTECVNTRSSTRIFYSAAVVVTNSTTLYLAYWFHSTRIISLFGNGPTKSMLTLSHGPFGCGCLASNTLTNIFFHCCIDSWKPDMGLEHLFGTY